MYTPRRRHCLILLFLASLATITALKAPPVRAQTPAADLAGVYRSDAMDNEITGDTLVWQLTLLPDHGAEIMTVFVTTDSVAYEVGRWEEDGEDGVVVTLERRFDYPGGRERAIEPPFDIPFVVDGDLLTAADYLRYGPRDLVLARTDDAPVSILAEDGDLRDELKPGLDDWPDSLYVGAYRTEDFTIRGETRWFALDLQDDGSARIDFPPVADNDAVYVRATWQNNGDGTITVVQLADINAHGKIVHTYKPPLLFSEMDRLESGALFARSILLPDGNQPIFSRVEAAPAVPGLTGDDATPSAAGLYGGGLVAEDVPKIAVILELREDGSLEAIVMPLDSMTAPTAALGVWEQTELTVTLTLSSEIGIEDGKSIVRPSEPRGPEVLVLDQGKLVGPEITFVPLPVRGDSAGAAQPASPAGEIPARATAEPSTPGTRNEPAAAEAVTYMVGREQLVGGRTVVLSLNGDGTASMSTQLGPDAGALLELGAWAEEGDNLVVTLDRSAYDGITYPAPYVLAFARTDVRTLTGLDYDTERYGEDLVLYDTRDY